MSVKEIEKNNDKAVKESANGQGPRSYKKCVKGVDEVSNADMEVMDILKVGEPAAKKVSAKLNPNDVKCCTSGNCDKCKK